MVLHDKWPADAICEGPKKPDGSFELDINVVKVTQAPHPTDETQTINVAVIDADLVAAKTADEAAIEADKLAKIMPLQALKADILALKKADLSDSDKLADAVLKIRDGLAAIEKEIFDI